NFNTHPWVLQEVTTALGLSLKAGEVWETKVTPAGMALNRQRLTYDATNRDKFLVDFVTMMGEWHSEGIERPQLVPEDVAKAYWKDRKHPGFQCTYTIRRGIRELPAVRGDIYPVDSALYVILRNVRRGDLASIQMQGGEEVWESSFTNV